MDVSLLPPDFQPGAPTADIMSEDEESLSTIVPGAGSGGSLFRSPSRRSSYTSRRSVSTSRGARSRSQSQDGPRSHFGSEESERPKFDHKTSILSFMTDDEEDDGGIPSAHQGQPVVETETVASVPLLGVGQGSIKVKKSTDQMGSGNSLAGSRAPSRARRKRLAAASRADIFAAKIASAMDEAPSSDSDETFVYDTNNTVRRPYALRTSSTLSLPVSPAIKSQRTNPSLYVQTVNSLSQSNTAEPSPVRSRVDEPRGRRRPAFLAEGQRRPSTLQKSDSIRAKHVYLNRWRGGELEDEDEDEGGPLIDEQTPLSRSVQTPHDYASNRQLAPFYIRVTLWFVGLAMCCMFCTFVVGVLVASSRPLVGVEIARLVDVFPSDRELVLSLIVQAKNPGCFTVSASQVDLDLFATTQYAQGTLELGEGGGEGALRKEEGDPLEDPMGISPKRTVLLGNVQELESPLTFSGSFFNPKHTFSMSTLRLVSPCENATELWQQIAGNPFELTVRGVLKYSLLFSQDLRTSVSSSIVVRGPEG